MIVGYVKGQTLKVSQPVVVSNSIDYLEMKFIFQSREWMQLAKVAHFKKGPNIYDIVLTGGCVRREDHLNLEDGEWEVYVHGNDLDGVMRVTTEPAKITVKSSGFVCGGPLPEMPLDISEQILAKAASAEKIADDLVAGEDARKKAEAERVQAEAGRIQAEEGRSSAEDLRVNAENLRTSAEEGRARNEQTRVTNENARIKAEKAREAADQIRKQDKAEWDVFNNEAQQSESQRVNAEQLRVNAEGGRVTAEQERGRAEVQRVADERDRETAETSRASAETSREESESNRKTAENTRSKAEQGRKTAEGERIKAESARDTAEAGRVEAEKARVAADAGRNQKITDIQNEVSNQSAQIALKADTKYVNDSFANAFVGNVSGDVIAVDDVSPIEHRVGCKVESKNLIDPSNVYIGGTVYDFFQRKRYKCVPGKTYTLSNSSKTTINAIYALRSKSGVVASAFNDYKLSFSVEIETDIYLEVPKTVPLEEWQFEIGSVATPYTPYIPDLSAVLVSRYGGNILPVPPKEKVEGGMTVTYENGEFHLVGSPTGQYPRFVDTGNYAGWVLRKGTVVTVTLDKPLPFGIIVFLKVSSTGAQEAFPVPSGQTTSTKALDKLDYADSLYAIISNFTSPIDARFKLTVSISDKSIGSVDIMAPQVISPDPDGTVSGMTSLSPYMTILSDDPGVTISAEYNKDSNKVVGNLQAQIEELKKAVIATGGNV